jgi:hypothetical protein
MLRGGKQREPQKETLFGHRKVVARTGIEPVIFTLKG